MQRLVQTLLLLALWLVIGCTPPPPGGPAPATDAQRAELALALRSMSPAVDAGEARRLADVAFDHPLLLARAYEITDSPFVHNIKVNRGEKPRGLCYHWAEDMETRLLQEEFRTLAIRRAISPVRPANPFEHSTVVATPPGAPLSAGIILDPWRFGGALYWTPVTEDAGHDWRPRNEVLREKQLRRLARAAR